MIPGFRKGVLRGALQLQTRRPCRQDRCDRLGEMLRIVLSGREVSRPSSTMPTQAGALTLERLDGSATSLSVWPSTPVT